MTAGLVTFFVAIVTGLFVWANKSPKHFRVRMRYTKEAMFTMGLTLFILCVADHFNMLQFINSLQTDAEHT